MVNVRRQLNRWIHFQAKGIHKTMAAAYRRQKYFAGPERGMIVVDAGANVGSAAYAYRKLFPSSRILCFEPDPQTVLTLTENLRGYPDVEIFPFALGDTPGKKCFYVNKSAATNSLYSPKQESIGIVGSSSIEQVGTIEVQVERLGDQLKGLGIDRIDLLKLDLQGGELDCLKGCADYLERGAVGMIYSEIEFIRLYDGQPLWGDIGVLLDQYGYDLVDLFNVRRRNKRLLWGDALFLPRTQRVSR